MKAGRVLMVFASVAGVIWLFGAVNLPRAVMVGDNLKQAKVIGAKAKIVFKVADEEGTPVPGAEISAGLFLWSTDHNAVNGKTDREGVLVVRGVTVGVVRYSVNKAGYYYTHGNFYIPKLPGASLKDGKWQPYGMEQKVVLKRIRNPIPMYAHPEIYRYDYFFPKLNTTYGFDAFKMDWIQPFGTGEHVDLLFEFTGIGFECNTNQLFNGNLLKGTLTMTWADQECGFYPASIEDSGLKSPHHADSNQTFMTSITLKKQFDINRKIVNLDASERITNMEEKCLVFRVRPRFSPDGKRIGVHYGKIYLPVVFTDLYPSESNKGAARLNINIYTNPTENDTNLEFLPYHSLNYPNERSKQPNIAP